jgi:hypothetical protein
MMICQGYRYRLERPSDIAHALRGQAGHGCSVWNKALTLNLAHLDRAFCDASDSTIQPTNACRTRKRRECFGFPQEVKLGNRQVYWPKVGWVGSFEAHLVQGKVKNATVVRGRS